MQERYDKTSLLYAKFGLLSDWFSMVFFAEELDNRVNFGYFDKSYYKQECTLVRALFSAKKQTVVETVKVYRTHRKIGQIDGLDDTKCTIASKLSKN